MNNLLIFGTGEFAELAHYYFRAEGKYNVSAFVVDKEYRKTDCFLNLPVVDSSSVEERYPPDLYKMFIAIGYSGINKFRAAKYNQAKGKGYELVSYVSPKASVFDNVRIGDNCFILEDNTIQPFVRIGNNVTLWSGNHVGHHSTIHDHCFIASHVVISGGVTVEPYCFIGVNATIRDHITIAAESVIGAACLILKDTRTREVYIGAPAEPRAITSDRLKRI